MANKYNGGGGEGMRQHVKTPIITGQPAHGVNPGAVSYLGNKVGNHATEGGTVANPNYTPMYGQPPVQAGAPLGNEVALNVQRGGPGTGRVTRGSGSQGQY
jgi:hypothetical protein